MKQFFKEILKIFIPHRASTSLPSTSELYLKAKYYTDVECILQNFYDEDELEVIRLRYMHGYEQAIKDFVNSNYNPDSL